MNSPIKAIAFDVYGTLFDVQSISSSCELFFPGEGESVSRLWREKQIQYTFLRQIMGRYEPFSKVTMDALRFASAAHGKRLSSPEEQQLMQAYQTLELFPESRETLEHLKQQGKQLVVFSNGSDDMLLPLLRYAEIDQYLDLVLTVDEVMQYKPSPAAYTLILDHAECKRQDIAFLSSNGWDISGAQSFGFHTAWINRSGQPQEELDVPPDVTYDSLIPLKEWF